MAWIALVAAGLAASLAAPARPAARPPQGLTFPIRAGPSPLPTGAALIETGPLREKGAT